MVGSVSSGVHGRTTMRQIVDWLPGRHLSFTERSPIGLCLWTMSLEPREGGGQTHVGWRIALRGGRKQALLMGVIGRRARKFIEENFEALVTYVAAANA